MYSIGQLTNKRRSDDAPESDRRQQSSVEDYWLPRMEGTGS